MSGKTYTIAQFAEALKRMEKAGRGKALKNAAMAGGYVVEAQAKINVEQTFHASTGNLAGSIFTEVVKADDTSAEVATGPSVIYGRIQELGGTVKPVKGKFLAIPVNAKKNSSPRNYRNLRLRIAKDQQSGVLLDGTVVMFALVKEVTLPARPYLRPAIDENEDKIIKAVTENLRIEIENAI